MFAKVALLATAAITFALPALAETIPGTVIDTAGQTPTQLYFGAGWNSAGYELWAIRHWIAQHAADTPIGVAAQAWLAANDDNKDKAFGLFQKCADVPDTAAYCGTWLLQPGYRERITAAQFKKISDLADNDKFGAIAEPTEFLSAVFRYRAEVLKDEPGALRQLNGWEYPRAKASVLLISGEWAVTKKDYEAAWKFFAQAIEAAPTAIVPRLDQIDLIVDHGSDAPFLKRAKDAGMLLLVQSYAKALKENKPAYQDQLSAGFLTHIGLRLSERLKAYAEAAQMYRRALEAHPSGDLVARWMDMCVKYTVNSYEPDKGGWSLCPERLQDVIAFLEQANAQIPNNPPILRELGWMEGTQDRATALKIFQAALALPMPAADRATTVRALGDKGYEAWGDFDGAKALYEKELATDQAAMLGDLWQNREEVGDYAATKAVLLQWQKLLESQHRANAGWFAAQERTLARVMSEAPMRETTSVTLPVPTIIETDGAIAVSPDGRYVATGFAPVELRDAGTGAKIREFGRGGVARAFSPNGKYLAVTSSFTEAGGGETEEVIIYEVASGRTIARLIRPEEVSAIAWSPDGNRLAYTTAFTLGLYDVDHRALISVRPLPSLRASHGMVWLKDGKQIAVSYYWGSALQLFDADSLRLTRTLKGGRFPHGIALSADGKYLCIADNEHILTVWNTGNPDEPPRSVKTKAIGPLFAAPDGIHMLIAGVFGSREHQLELFDLQALKPVAEASVVGYGSAAFTPDGNTLLRAGKDAIEILDPHTLAPLRLVQGGGQPIKKIAVDAADNRLLVGDDQGITVWNLETRTKLFYWSGIQLIAAFGKSAPDQFLGREQGGAHVPDSYVVLNSRDFAVTPKFNLFDKIVKITASAIRGRYLVLAGVLAAPTDTELHDGNVAAIGVYDLENPHVVGTVTVPVSSFYGEWDTISNPKIESVDVTPDGKEVAYVTSWVDGYRTGTQRAQTVRLMSLATKDETNRLEFAEPVYSIRFAEQGEAIEAVLPSALYKRDVATEKTVTVDSRWGRGRTVIQLHASGGAVIYDPGLIASVDESGHAIDRWFSDNLSFVAVDEPLSLVVAVTTQGEIELLDLATLTPKVLPHG